MSSHTPSQKSQKVSVDFATDDKEKQSKWSLEELEEAWVERSPADRGTSTGQRMLNRINQLKDLKDKSYLRNEELERRNHDLKLVILGGIIGAFITFLLTKLTS